MSDKENLKVLKSMLDDNEKKYGKEIREKYGEDTVNASNQKFMNMTQEEYDKFQRLSQEVLDTLEQAYQTGDPAGELAQKAADLHRQWLSFTWNSYSKEAHAGLAQMYVDDERFTAYYDRISQVVQNFERCCPYLYRYEFSVKGFDTLQQ